MPPWERAKRLADARMRHRHDMHLPVLEGKKDQKRPGRVIHQDDMKAAPNVESVDRRLVELTCTTQTSPYSSVVIVGLSAGLLIVGYLAHRVLKRWRKPSPEQTNELDP